MEDEEQKGEGGVKWSEISSPPSSGGPRALLAAALSKSTLPPSPTTVGLHLRIIKFDIFFLPSRL